MTRLNSMRVLPNGDIVFPKRGSPPRDIPGYVRDPGDPYVFNLDLESCEHRCFRHYLRPCGKTGTTMYCNKFNKSITAQNCLDCEYTK